MKRIVVIGNGPSLTGFDFHRLDGIDTLGMNAAYRHWDRIDWYPTYYCCLDDQLILTHHEEIRRLVESGKVRSALLEGSFFEFHPDCLNDQRFLSFDEFSPYWHEKRGRYTNRPLRHHSAFVTSAPSKLTTGSGSVRFAAFLGYSEIRLIGIDLRYVEILPEAEATSGIGLRVKSTPLTNPNYFIPDYQQEGDRYNVPNPAQHNGNLHIEAFRVLRDDFAVNTLPVALINCNPSSALCEQAIFPTQDIDILLGPSRLGAVVVPCNAGEKDQILANLKLWAQPAFFPLASPRKSKPILIFAFNNETANLAAEDIERVFHVENLSRFFSGIKFEFFSLFGARDAYIRDYSRQVGEDGFKAGPNNQFFATMRSMVPYGPYVFLMESDCVPIRPDWLGRLMDLVDHSERFWVLGSAYRGVGTLSKNFSRHINGNAVYAVGDPSFQDFVSDFWEPRLKALVRDADRRIAYDCALEVAFNSANSLDSLDETWAKWKDTAHLFRFTDFVRNLSARRDNEEATSDMVQAILADSHETHIVHSQPLAKAVSQILDFGSITPLSIRVQPLVGAPSTQDKTSTESLSFVCYTTGGSATEISGDYVLPGGIENYVICLFGGSISEGEVLECTIDFELKNRALLNISLCRASEGPFEQSKIVNQFAPGRHVLTLRHEFSRAFSAARIQVSSTRDPATLTIHETNMTRARPV